MMKKQKQKSKYYVQMGGNIPDAPRSNTPVFNIPTTATQRLDELRQQINPAATTNTRFSSPYLQSNTFATGPQQDAQIMANNSTIGQSPSSNPQAAQARQNQEIVKSTFMNPRANELNPYFKGFNALALGATAIAGQVNSIKADRKEEQQYLEAINPVAYENMERYSLNTNPVYSKYGGSITKYQTGGSAQISDDYYEANATLAYYKNILNDKLKSKNPEAFSNYFKGLVDLRKANKPEDASKYIQETAYNDFLAPDEVKGTLGEDNYNRYLSSLKRVNQYNVQQGKMPLYGVEEGQGDVTQLNYGRRFASLQVNPTFTASNDTGTKKYNRSYNYNPQTNTVDYTEEGDFTLRPNTFRTSDNSLTSTSPQITKMQNGGMGKNIIKKNPEIMQAVALSKYYTPQQKSSYAPFPTLQNGGFGNINVEAEQGEAFMDIDGDVDAVPTNAPTHEEGGVLLADVQKVLENTSNIRKDRDSKFLRLDPKQIEAFTGLKSNKFMSHAEALVKADENNEKQRNMLTKKIELASKDKNVLDKYAEESIKLNMQHFQAIPTKKELFETLFNHQELVKDVEGIGMSKKAKYGGKYIAAIGGEFDEFGNPTPPDKTGKWAGDKLKTRNPRTGATSNNWNAMTDFSSPQAYAQAVGYEGDPTNIKAMQQWVMQKYPDLVNKYHSTSTGYGQPIAGRPDDGKLGVRWQDIAKEISTKLTPVIEDPAPQPTPITQQRLDPTIKNNLKLNNNPQSRFNEPLRWYDVASPIQTFLAANERVSEQYNPAQFNQLRYKLMDPTAALQKNQSDFNSAIQAVQNTSPSNAGVQLANIANLAAQKYSFNNQVLGNYENQNAQIKNQEILYNTQVRDKQSLSDQQSRAIFEDKVLTSKAKQQEQKLTALDSLYKTIAENNALNRNGNLMMKFSRAFDQYGDWNGYTPQFQVNPALGMSPQPVTGKGNAAGGLQGLKAGSNYYNRKTGETLFFDGNSLKKRQ